MIYIVSVLYCLVSAVAVEQETYKRTGDVKGEDILLDLVIAATPVLNTGIMIASLFKLIVVLGVEKPWKKNG